MKESSVLPVSAIAAFSVRPPRGGSTVSNASEAGASFRDFRASAASPAITSGFSAPNRFKLKRAAAAAASSDSTASTSRTPACSATALKKPAPA